MKITKTSVSVFLLTFLIGYASVLRFQKVPASIETPTLTQETLSYSSIEQTTEPPQKEIIEWQEEDESKFTIKLLQTGEGFHGDEIKAKSDETWLGLFEEKGNYVLRSTKIKIRPAEDVVVDEPGEATGKAVIVKGDNRPVFLLKNAKFLKEGPIETIFHNPSDEESTGLRNGFSENYEMNGKKYTLSVEGGENSSTLILETENKKQILFSVDKMGDATWNLVWVGDLDGDGELDLFANLPVFYNFTEYRLFLSSKAEKNKLIKQVAIFHTSGC